MTAEQWARLVEQYGFPAAFALVSIVGVVGVIFMIVKAYPILSGLVAFINLITGSKGKPGLDARLDGIETASKEGAEADTRKEEALSGIREDLANHIKWSEGENAKIVHHIEIADRQQAEWEAIRDSWIDLQAKVGKMAVVLDAVDAKAATVVHEVKHNGGSSIKDSTARQEDRLDAILRILEERQ